MVYDIEDSVWGKMLFVLFDGGVFIVDIFNIESISNKS